MLNKRVITALWGLPLVLASVWFDGPLPWFTILAAVFGLLGVLEFYRITGVARVPALLVFGGVLTLLFIVSPHFPFGMVLPLLLTAAVILPMALLLFLRDRAGGALVWAWTLAGIFYAGWLMSYLVSLRLEAGREWLLLTLLVTFASDSAAFFVGRSFGRHRLAPRVSPGKTWEGAAAGLVGAVAISLGLTALLKPMGYPAAALFGVVISVCAQLGDLVESRLKRSGGVKESGRLLPGHGGVLDRMDSLVFAGVAAYYFFLAASLLA
ncbi:MAG: phosphatidate cytidylyltransferase [Chloroflexi bacterium]|nr:phosphatidate cytidylyltransferase [Chloroflexota bacterium]